MRHHVSLSSMQSEVRQRGSAAPHTRERRETLERHDKGKSTPHDSPILPDGCIMLYLLMLVGMVVLSLHYYRKLPEPALPTSPNQFDVTNARRHLLALTDLGTRHVGSTANEVYARDLIVSKVEEIRSQASQEVMIEIDIQQPSGHFFLDFLGKMTHFYHNLTNVVVRFSRKGTSPKHAFLINAHFDSALGTVAASDDAVSCGTMLEVLRSISANPSPLLPEHAVIFLFNGAEETILQASHGFITQHPWARQVKAFLNLEACGAGGREIVFQTGPDNPWLARLYAKSAPHPHASVIAQEVFQSGIIPSDTDFRVFRDHGHIPGIDTAYFVNGYVYHTE